MNIKKFENYNDDPTLGKTPPEIDLDAALESSGMKIYTYTMGAYGSGVCIASSEEEAIEIFKKNYTYGNWRIEDCDMEELMVHNIEKGFCHIDIGDQ